VEQAQGGQATSCGKLIEKRVSPLLVRPLVLRGSFCAAGLELFRVEYAGPEPARVIYNRGALNVSTDGGKRTTAFDVSRAVQRAQRYFAGPRAAENLERDFSITVAETAERYTLLLRPVSGRIAGRVKRVAVELDKLDFLPRRIEIDGKSGVDSSFEIEIERLDTPLEKGLFDVYRP
jgi:outer membrane lipoprotein-sorting protein